MTAICQRCGSVEASRTVREAALHVGQLVQWKVQLCEGCTKFVEQALVQALRRR